MLFCNNFEFFFSSHSVLSDGVDNVVHYTMPEAVWMLQWLGRSPFSPHPTHSHSSGLNWWQPHQGGGRPWTDPFKSLSSDKGEECPSSYLLYPIWTRKGNEKDENIHVSVTGQPVFFQHKQLSLSSLVTSRQCINACLCVHRNLSKSIANNPTHCFLFRLFLTWEPGLHQHWPRIIWHKGQGDVFPTHCASSSIKYLLLQNFHLSSMKPFLWTAYKLPLAERCVLQLGLRCRKLLLPPAELWLRLLLGAPGACHSLSLKGILKPFNLKAHWIPSPFTPALSTLETITDVWQWTWKARKIATEGKT